MKFGKTRGRLSQSYKRAVSLFGIPSSFCILATWKIFHFEDPLSKSNNESLGTDKPLYNMISNLLSSTHLCQFFVVVLLYNLFIFLTGVGGFLEQRSEAFSPLLYMCYNERWIIYSVAQIYPF